MFIIAVKYGSRKLMNLNEALESLKNLDVSSEDDLSEDEHFISNGRLVILPPNFEGDRDTNEDSG